VGSLLAEIWYIGSHRTQALLGERKRVKKRTEKTSTFRKLSILGFEMVKGGHNFYALLEFDVSDLRKELRQYRQRSGGGSFFAFMLKAIGTCLREFPEFNSMINRLKKTTFYEVDIDIPIEIAKDEEIYNRQQIIRNISEKTVNEIETEIRQAKSDSGEQRSYMSSSLGQRIITTLPKWLVMAVFRLILRNHRLVKSFSGTAFVTSVSMFSNAPGHVIPFAGGPKAVSFAVGSVVKKPVVRKNEIVIREILHLTAVFNHDLVDGAPAARFVNQLRRYIETDYGALLD
jgi:pyruvate/2-oxoglutarate dehydrogenase complex dihydrolipoamide acyltransferase (E2) component